MALHEPLRTAFKRCVVVVNPVSTHAVPVRRRIKALQQLFPKKNFHLIETSAEGRAANQALLAKHSKLLGPDTLLCIAAGDGTCNMFAESLALDADLPKIARKTVLLPLWGGNANDLAYMLNGRPPSMTRLLETGAVVDIRPLECTLTYQDGGTETRVGVCYVSFGATAHATEEMAKESHRNHPLRRLHASRILFELLTGFLAFSKAPSFHVQEEKKRKTIYERMVINGPRYAKIGRTPVGLKEDKFFMHSLESTKPISALPMVIKVARPAYGGKSLYKKASFAIEEPTLAQLDGELMKIPADTKVNIRLAKEPLRMLSIRLA